MRESARTLKRADLIIITRANLTGGEKTEKLAVEISALSSAPVLKSDTLLDSIKNLRTGEQANRNFFENRRVCALCGIGNPESFRKLLEKEGIPFEKFMIFKDHHKFSETDVKKLDGGSVWLTTEKDAVKLAKFSALRNFYSVNVKQRFDNDRIKNFILQTRS